MTIPSTRHRRPRHTATGLCVLALLCWSSLAPGGHAQSVSADSPASKESSNGGVIAQHLPTLAYRGGPFLRHPRIVTVTFAGDDERLVTRLEQFGDTITRTTWWRAVSDGYCAADGDCIGEGRPGVAVRLRESLPADVHAVEISALLARAITAGHLGTLDDESLLLVYLPAGITLRDAFVPRYCGAGPRAFHRSLRIGRRVIGYAVMPRCADEASLTGTASHELLETVMNPDTSRPAFAFPRDSSARGFAAAGDEAMDPCGFLSADREVVEGAFVVRRSWSARAAAQGRNPCVPAASPQPFLALVPEQPVVRLLNSGDTVTIEVHAAADRPAEAWTVSAVDLTGSQRGEHYVDVALDRSQMSPGDTGTLRVALRKVPPQGLTVVGLVSTVGGNSYLWPVAVVTR